MSNFFMDIFIHMGVTRILEALDSTSVTSSRQIARSGEKIPVSSSRQKPFSEIIKEASIKYGIDEGIIGAVIKQESSFNSQAKSSCGAMGLMQLLQDTAKRLDIRDAFNPEETLWRVRNT